MTREEAKAVLYEWQKSMVDHGVPLDTSNVQALRVAIEALSDRMIDRAELFNKLAILKAPPEANAYKAEVYRIINEMGEDKV